MTYSCTDFTDTILDALGIEVPEECNDSPSHQADLALVEIERLQRFALSSLTTTDRVSAACAAMAHLREAYKLLKNAPRTRERVRLAITSAGGAIRHARHHRGTP